MFETQFGACVSRRRSGQGSGRECAHESDDEPIMCSAALQLVEERMQFLRAASTFLESPVFFLRSLVSTFFESERLVCVGLWTIVECSGKPHSVCFVRWSAFPKSKSDVKRSEFCSFRYDAG